MPRTKDLIVVKSSMCQAKVLLLLHGFCGCQLSANSSKSIC
jgi:hypothetical protein